MRSPLLPLCVDCKYFRGAKNGECEAFPKHIPDQLWAGKVRHDNPYPGDRGIQFQPRDISEFLSVVDLAKLLSVDPKTIYRAVWSKTLPAYRIGRTWRIAKRDIEGFRK